MKNLLTVLIFFIALDCFAQCDESMVFSNDSTNAVCFEVDGKVRTIYSNDLPNHSYGTWPSNNPVDPQEFTFHMCAYPRKAQQNISVYDAGNFMGGCSQYIEFGVGSNGVRLAPFGARWFVNPMTQQENRDWNVEALEMFSMDFNNSHSNGDGAYHYHGIPYSYFVDSLNIDGSEHSPIVGYAADGFPIYYKYAYSDSSDANSSIVEFSSGHTLKSGNRPGNGIDAPDGAYDGFYVEDYEFIDQNWALDECNGRYGVTPDFPNGTYYYLMTDNWPYIPRCFYGTVLDNSFRIGPNCPASDAEIDCSELMVNTVNLADRINISIRPNPSSSTLEIFGFDSSIYAEITQISIYDLTGRIWFSENRFRPRIEISSFPAGNYYLQIDFRKTQVTKKLIVH